MTIKLKGSSDGSVSFDAPADTSPSGSDITLTLPTSAGSANQFLKNSGTAGTLEYSSMVETSTGIGIGTSSPGAPLEVNGGDGLLVKGSSTDSFIQNYATENNYIEFKDAGGSAGNINYNHTSNYLSCKVNGSERVRLDSSGRFLFNTTSNQGGHLFQIKGGDVSLTKLAEASGGNAVHMLRFRVHNSNNTSQDASLGGISAETVSGWGGSLTFHTKNANGSPNETLTERMRITSTGYSQFGGYLAETSNHRINGVNDTQGSQILVVSGYQSSGGSSQDTAMFYAVNTGGSVSSAQAAIRVYRSTGTNRSINTAGTINASGADYAEYMTKAGDFTLAKGDICGINSEGKLTNVFADAISFVVKSTDPSYVGGDKWHEAVGEEPGGYDDDRTEEEIAAATVVYEEALEAARQLVDRIAFSGQVPVNVTGASPGQHIIPTAAADGSIEGTAKAEADLTMAEYMSSVGKVIAIEDDGRAKIIVKVA